MVDVATLPVQLPAPPVSPPAAGVAASANRAAAPDSRPRNPSNDDQPKEQRFSDALNQARDRKEDARGQDRRKPGNASEDDNAVAAQQAPQEFRQLSKPGAEGGASEAEGLEELDVDKLAGLLLKQFPDGFADKEEITSALQALPQDATPRDVFAALVVLLKDAPADVVTNAAVPVIATETAPVLTPVLPAAPEASAQTAPQAQPAQPDLFASLFTAQDDAAPDAPEIIPAVSAEAPAATAPSTPAVSKLLSTLSEFFAAQQMPQPQPAQPAATLPAPALPAALLPQAPVQAQDTVLPALPAAPQPAANNNTVPATDPLAALPTATAPAPQAAPTVPVTAENAAQPQQAAPAAPVAPQQSAPDNIAAQLHNPTAHAQAAAETKTAAPAAPATRAPSTTSTEEAKPTVPSVAPAFLPADSESQDSSADSQNPQSDTSSFTSLQPQHGNASRQVENDAPSFTRVLAEARTSNLADQMVAHVKAASKNGESRIEVQLSPEELGKVQIRLSVVDGRATMQFTADNPKTLDMLRSDVRQLENMLRDVGLKTDSGSLSFNLRDEGQPGQQQQQQQGNGQGYRGKTVDALEEAMNQQAYRAYSLTEADGLDIRI